MTGVHSLRTEMEESRGRKERESKNDFVGKPQEQNRICSIREDRADADSLLTPACREAKLGNVFACLKKQQGFAKEQ